MDTVDTLVVTDYTYMPSPISKLSSVQAFFHSWSPSQISLSPFFICLSCYLLGAQWFMGTVCWRCSVGRVGDNLCQLLPTASSRPVDLSSVSVTLAAKCPTVRFITAQRCHLEMCDPTFVYSRCQRGKIYLWLCLCDSWEKILCKIYTHILRHL